nr:hypothetical protein Q903MT_gene696 [Picea sitchensis]
MVTLALCRFDAMMQPKLYALHFEISTSLNDFQKGPPPDRWCLTLTRNSLSN